MLSGEDHRTEEEKTARALLTELKLDGAGFMVALPPDWHTIVNLHNKVPPRCGGLVLATRALGACARAAAQCVVQHTARTRPTSLQILSVAPTEFTGEDLRGLLGGPADSKGGSVFNHYVSSGNSAEFQEVSGCQPIPTLLR